MWTTTKALGHLADGRPADVATVVATYGDFLWLSLQRLGVRATDAPDLMQEVLVVVHRRLSTLESAASIHAWLFGICLRVAVAHRRRAYVRRERAVEDVPEDREAPAPADPEAALATRQAHARLQAVLDTMDPARRAVFVMYEVEELSCAEIAALLDVPVGTVHSRLHAARKEFERALARADARDAARGGRR